MAKAKEKLVVEHAAKIKEINKITKDGTNSEVESKIEELANIEKQYLALHEKEVFSSLVDTRAAVEMHDFSTLYHKKVSQDGVFVGVKASERVVQIDLYKFCEYKNLDTSWWYDLQALNARLTGAVASELGVTGDELKAIRNNYYMDKLARDIELGKTPYSNTQVIKHIQHVTDELVPDAGKICNKHLAYIRGGYTKVDRKNMRHLVCAKHSSLLSLLTTVLNGLVTDDTYGVTYRQAKTNETEPLVETAPVADAPVAETPAENK